MTWQSSFQKGRHRPLYSHTFLQGSKELFQRRNRQPGCICLCSCGITQLTLLWPLNPPYVLSCPSKPAIRSRKLAALGSLLVIIAFYSPFFHRVNRFPHTLLRTSLLKNFAKRHMLHPGDTSQPASRTPKTPSAPRKRPEAHRTSPPRWRKPQRTQAKRAWCSPFPEPPPPASSGHCQL